MWFKRAGMTYVCITITLPSYALIVRQMYIKTAQAKVSIVQVKN
jgi:hypothetical protein